MKAVSLYCGSSQLTKCIKSKLYCLGDEQEILAFNNLRDPPMYIYS